ncbi:bZIP transcription factor 29-like [Musa acuminata AAA Group]|uniref:bZIP transcription factor 29-like n=1 Tax=Musa acuminata AAA Group TaxID=214697 RepID=UPI0031D6AB07
MEDSRSGMMQRFHSSSSSSAAAAAAPTLPSSSCSSFSSRLPSPLDLPNFALPFRHFSASFSPDASTAAKRPGIPPIPPSPSSSPAAAVASPFHSRSLSQPLAFDSLPHLTPPPPPLPLLIDPMMVDDRPPVARTPGPRDGLPPRRAHRRSNSDIPFGLPLPSPPAAQPPLHQRPAPSPKQAEASCVEDDLIITYMDSFDTLNSGTEEKQEDVVESSRLSGTRTSGADSSENEAESSVNESGGDGSCGRERKEGNKRSAVGDLTAMNPRHRRSLSMDSSFMGKLHFGDESPKFPASPGNQMGQLSRSGSMDETMNTFSLEFGNGEFSSAEMKKIMADEKLAEMALADPKKVKRILANRLSAARSKERKMRYITELEHKVQILQTEATTLSAQLTLLQRDSAGLASQNNELKFRLQAMEQQAQLKDALNEALSAEVQRLKLATGEISEAQLSKSINRQMQLNPPMSQLHQLQLHQQQQKQQTAETSLQLPAPQQQQNDVSAKLESSKC